MCPLAANSVSSASSIIYVLNHLPFQPASLSTILLRTPSHPKNHTKMLGCIFLIVRLILRDKRREEQRRAQEAQNNPVAPVAQNYPPAPVTQVAPQYDDPTKEPQTNVVPA
jgi:hypothetical protein